MGHGTASTSGQGNSALITVSDRQLNIKKMDDDLARLIHRTNTVADEVSAALNRVIEQHESPPVREGTSVARPSAVQVGKKKRSAAELVTTSYGVWAICCLE